MQNPMKIGDSVSVVNDNLKGKIITIHGKKLTIQDFHGFSYEFLESEVVLEQPEIYNELKVIKKDLNLRSISKKHDKKPIVLDLHFENIGKKNRSYDSFERLFLQKEKLLQTIEYCRANYLKKLEIIHGIGDGVLQQMVHEVLESQTNLEFHNNEILHHQSSTVIVYFR